MTENNNRLLLVDDEQDITFALSIGLEDNGFLVDSFNDPLLALQSFKEKNKKENDPYDLALIDIKMPKMNGIELYNEIRKINEKVKVCFITAFEMQKDERFSPIVKLNDKDKPTIIRKAIEVDELVKKLKAMIPNS